MNSVLGHIYNKLKWKTKAVSCFEMKLEIAKGLKNAPGEIIQSYLHLGSQLCSNDKFDRAMFCFKEALEINKDPKGKRKRKRKENKRTPGGEGSHEESVETSSSDDSESDDEQDDFTKAKESFLLEAMGDAYLEKH